MLHIRLCTAVAVLATAAGSLALAPGATAKAVNEQAASKVGYYKPGHYEMSLGWVRIMDIWGTISPGSGTVKVHGSISLSRGGEKKILFEKGSGNPQTVVERNPKLNEGPEYGKLFETAQMPRIGGLFTGNSAKDEPWKVQVSLYEGSKTLVNEVRKVWPDVRGNGVFVFTNGKIKVQVDQDVEYRYVKEGEKYNERREQFLAAANPEDPAHKCVMKITGGKSRSQDQYNKLFSACLKPTRAKDHQACVDGLVTLKHSRELAEEACRLGAPVKKK